MIFGPLRRLRPFYDGVLVDQNMQACHWKTHNTFPNFFLKDLTWSDNDNNMFLGPVVAAQQVLGPSPQTSHPQKERKGGHIRYSQVFRSPSQDLGIGLPFKMLQVRSFCIFSLSSIRCIKDLSTLSLISCSVANYENSNQWAGFFTCGWSLRTLTLLK